MYDKEQLLEKLTLDDIKTLLAELGAQHIRENLDKNEIITNTICHNISDGKMKLYYYIEDKRFRCYTHCDESFNIFDLVIKNHALRGIELNLAGAIRWILETLGIDTDNSYKPEGFHSLKKGVRQEILWLENFKPKEKVEIELKTYSDKILDLFSKEPHPMFLADNISKEAMRKFEVMYYEKRNRIIIPHRHHYTGEIIGLKSRCLNFYDIENGYKYIPLNIGEILYSYPSSMSLYGYYQNKENIKKYKRVMIFESEKSVHQCETYFPNKNIAVAVSGSNISEMQRKLILELGVKEVIICMDKEYEIANTPQYEAYYEKLNRLADMFTPYVNTSLVLDKKSLLEYKDSPRDKGVHTLVELLKSRQLIETKNKKEN